MVCGVAIPTLNGVWDERNDADPDAIAKLLEQVAATGLRHCLQLRPGANPVLAQLAAGLSMSPGRAIPLMVMEQPRNLGGPSAGGELTIRQLSPDGAHLHAEVSAAGFEAPEELFRQLMTSDVLRLPGLRCYVGETDGQAVTTGVGLTLGGSVAVFNIATPPAHRRHGYGTALTQRAIVNGLAAGAEWSWLQSSPAGYASYGRLGFRTVETWPCWVTLGDLKR
jgi:N-acetylglutamate synthase